MIEYYPQVTTEILMMVSNFQTETEQLIFMMQNLTVSKTSELQKGFVEMSLMRRSLGAISMFL